MKLEHAVAVIEQRWKCVDGLAADICQTTEPYETVTSQGHWVNAQAPRAAGCGSEDAAVTQWMNAVMRYGLQRRGTLYWRVRPRIETESQRQNNHEVELFNVTSRLVISDKPVMLEDLKALKKFTKNQAVAA